MNIDVEKMLEEKGIDEAFLINAVESMAMILRGNNYTEQFMPSSYNLPEDKSDNGAFAEQVNMMLTDTTLALASIAVGVDALAAVVANSCPSVGAGVAGFWGLVPSDASVMASECLA